MSDIKDSSTRNWVLPGLACAVSVWTAGCGGESSFDEPLGMEDEPLIFGADERLDFGAMSSQEQARSRAVAIHAFSSGVSCAGGTCTLANAPFNTSPEGLRLCSGVRFRGQDYATSGNCSAWLVAPNLVATAGHCIDTSTCSTSRYIFGFTAAADGTGEVTSFPQSDVYSCSSVVTRVYDGNNPTNSDYALVKLDRVVSGQTPFFVRYLGEPALNLQLNMYGHPSALPKKITRNAWIQNATSAQRLYANGDIFGGNSGGPVIDLATGVGEGIVVTQPVPRFSLSSDAQGSCHVYRTCPDTGCTDPSLPMTLTGAMRITKVPGIPLHVALQSTVSQGVL
jgi:hypothetical protein